MESVNSTLIKITKELKDLKDPEFAMNMSKFGIYAKLALGIRIPLLRKLARKFKNNHDLALELWKINIHEAKILAVFVESKNLITPEQMQQWAEDFYSWDICDQCCTLFSKTPYAYEMCMKWSLSNEEFIKRAGFSMMATMAVHATHISMEDLTCMLARIELQSQDERNFVKKSINWALRQLGKRNMVFHTMAFITAEKLAASTNATSKWIGRDALKEFNDKKLFVRVKK